MNATPGLRPSSAAARFAGREVAAIAALLLLIFLFDCFTIREGHVWGDDFAMYIHHAENIALHRPYADTGYIYNPREAWYGPRSYPPVFPALLAPVIAAYGLNLHAMKVEEIVASTLSLLLVFLLFRKELPLPYCLALLALLGFNPLIWDAKDGVTSDFPFWLFFLLSALLLERAPRAGRASLLAGCATGIVLYLCYGTRSIGLVVFPGLLLYDWLRYRRISLFAILSVVTAAALIVLQRVFLTSTEGSYAEQFHPTLRSILLNVHDYAAVLASLFPWTAGRVVSYLLFALMTLLAISGAYLLLRKRGPRPLDCMLIIYIPLIVIWPGNQGLRFLLPVLPAYFAYALFGLSAYSTRLPVNRPQSVALAGLLAWSGVLYAGDFRKRNFAQIAEATGRPSFNALCAFIKHDTPPSDVFVFYRARALSLFTDRPASVYFLDGTAALYDEQWQYFRRIGVNYIVYSRLFEPDRQFLKPVLDRHPQSLKAVYNNPDFTVYQMQP